MKIILKVTLGIIVSLAMSMSAQALDYKSVHGATCNAYLASQATRVNHSAKGIYSNAAGSTWVSCGVPRDNIFNTNGTGNLHVWVNAAPTVRTHCYVRSAKPNGSNAQTIHRDRLGSGWIWLDTSLSVINGSYMVYCNLAKGTSLSTIRVGEFPNTAN